MINSTNGRKETLMKTIGIIAEYNPFHNGHAYQISHVKKTLGADYVVVAMSGDFVQRGAPAILDKYTRSRMALSCGADLVLELPLCFATASAEDFAMAGVTLFDRLGITDGICFGAETTNLALLNDIAALLAEEPDAYRSALSSYIKEGLTFPAARTLALTDCLCAGCNKTTDVSILTKLLSSPNNILAIEYLKAVKRRHSALTPFLLPREGAGYHDTSLPAKALTTLPAKASTALPHFASATAIRQALLKTPDASGFNALSPVLPPAAFSLLEEAISVYPPVTENDFSQILGYLLLSGAARDKDFFSEFADCNADISRRICALISSYRNFKSFTEEIKSRDITYTRAARILTHILLSVTKDDVAQAKSLDYIPYLRMLGFRKDAAPLLSAIKKNADIPLISRLSDARPDAQKNILSQNAFHVLEKDIFAADLYTQIRSRGSVNTFRSEYAMPIVIV